MVKGNELDRMNFRHIAECIPDGIWVADLDWNNIYMNSNMAKMFGYHIKEFIRMHPTDIMTDESVEKGMKVFGDALEEGKTHKGKVVRRLTLTYFHKGNYKVTHEVHASLYRDKSGNPLGLIGINRDISDFLITKDSKLQSQKLEAIGELAGGIAHDFNNTLGAMSAYVSLLQDAETTDTEKNEFLNAMAEMINTSKIMISQLLGFARRGETKKEMILIGPTLHSIIEIVKKTHKACEFIVHVPDNLELKIFADKGQLQQAVMNLLLNAVDAVTHKTNEGYKKEITLRIRFESVTISNNLNIDGGNYIIINILDSGRGVPDVIKEKIFEPFFTTKRAGEGSGLGLASAYGIAKKHNGTLVLDDIADGTGFSFYLPIDNITGEDTIVKKRDLVMSDGKKNILLIDDTVDLTVPASLVLKRLGYDVTVINDPRQVEDVFEPEVFDIVLLDMVMPHLSGDQVMQIIQKKCPTQKVIAASGYTEKSVKGMLDMGCVAFLKKPFEMETLSKVLHEHLGNEQQK